MAPCKRLGRSVSLRIHSGVNPSGLMRFFKVKSHTINKFYHIVESLGQWTPSQVLVS